MTPALAPAPAVALGRPEDERRIDGKPGRLRAAGERRIEGEPDGLFTSHERRIEGEPDGLSTSHERRIEGEPDGLFTSHEWRFEGEPGGDSLDLAVRHNARTLHAVCAELLPGYAAASREPWRQSLLTAGCLDDGPRRPAARRGGPPLIVEDVVQPSDVLCALWLARRCGLFSPGSSCGDAVGQRSACEIVPAFAPGFAQRDALLTTLRANTAWRAHLAARAVFSRAA